MKRIPRFEFRGTKMNKESSCMLKYFQSCSLYSYKTGEMGSRMKIFQHFSISYYEILKIVFQACMSFRDDSTNIIMNI